MTNNFKILCTVVIIGFSYTIAGEIISVSELLKNRTKYDKQEIRVYGIVTDLKSRTSIRGNHYFTFNLSDKKSVVTVFKYGYSSVDNDDSVLVQGVFHEVKHVNNYTFYDQLEADSIDLYFDEEILKTELNPIDNRLFELQKEKFTQYIN